MEDNVNVNVNANAPVETPTHVGEAAAVTPSVNPEGGIAATAQDLEQKPTAPLADSAYDVEWPDENEIYDEKNIPAGNWFKFENIGDKVSGYVDEIFDKESNSPTLPDQRIFVLKQRDGELINVPVKKTSQFLMDRTKRVQIGDFIAFKFEKEIPATTKGFDPAKSISVYVLPSKQSQQSRKDFR